MSRQRGTRFKLYVRQYPCKIVADLTLKEEAFHRLNVPPMKDST